VSPSQSPQRVRLAGRLGIPADPARVGLCHYRDTLPRPAMGLLNQAASIHVIIPLRGSPLRICPCRSRGSCSERERQVDDILEQEVLRNAANWFYSAGV